MSNTLPFEVLDELFEANLVAGVLFWKHRPRSFARITGPAGQDIGAAS